MSTVGAILDQLGRPQMFAMCTTADRVGLHVAPALAKRSTDKATHVRIVLAPDDTYTASGSRGTRKYEIAEVAEPSGLHADNQHASVESITGLGVAS